jgi:two-component system sensor histidine kinase DesK
LAFRILPPDNEQGWTPYAWLIYAIPFILSPVFRGGLSWSGWTLHILATFAFLGLYFRAYWIKGPRLGWIAAGLTMLGLACTPGNPSAIAFFVYAGVFLGWTGHTKSVCGGTLLIALAVGVEAWLTRFPAAVTVAGLVFPTVFAFVMLHFAQRDQANAKLRLAQAEVEHLARLAERERIARDLHDLLGHTLSVIVLKSELAAKLASRDPERAAREIREVEAVAREALQEVRGAVQGYRSMGLSSELARAATVLRDAGLEVESKYEPAPLSPVEESVLSLVLREAVTNILRHAQATRCEILAGLSNAAFELQVADNGRGGAAPAGSGLLGMRERIEALGGSLDRFGEGGTRLLIRLPRASA